MKKLLLIATTWLVLAGCTKDALAPAMEDTNGPSAVAALKADPTIDNTTLATIKYYGDPMTDGLGWVLVIRAGDVESKEETAEVPNNLPDEFKKDGAEVKVVYKKTTQRVPCRCMEPKYYVEITSIDWAR
jgi:hypothetical protein